MAQRQNPDGTYDLLLEAIARVGVDELPAEGLSYRRADLSTLRDAIPADGLDASELTALLTLSNRIARILEEAQPEFRLAMDSEAEPGTVVDRIADQLVLDPGARQEVLECLDVRARIRLVIDQLARLHLALDSQPSRGSTLH